MTAQVADAERTPAGWLLAAMPALGFLTVVKLLIRRIPADTVPEPPRTTAPTPMPMPSQRDAPAARPLPAAVTRPTERAAPAPEPERKPVSTPAPTSTPTPARTARSSRLRLPAGMHELITAAADKAADEGRALTAADIRAAARVSEDLAQQILTDLAPATA